VTGRILTVVSGHVDPARGSELIEGFGRLTDGPTPDGLVRSELLQGPGGRWVVQTLWRDRAALDAMRARPEPPAAPTLFRSVGSDPVLEILEVAADLTG
jgi:hypothetical protein